MKQLQTHTGPQARPRHKGRPLRWLATLFLLLASVAAYGQPRATTGMDMYIDPTKPDRAATVGNTLYIMDGDGIDVFFFVGTDIRAAEGSVSGTVTCETYQKELRVTYEGDGAFSIDSVRMSSFNPGRYSVRAEIKYRSLTGGTGELQTVNLLKELVVVRRPDASAGSSLGSFGGQAGQVFSGQPVEFSVSGDDSQPDVSWMHVLEIDGSVVESYDGASHTFSYTFTNTGTTVETRQVSMVSRYMIGGKQIGEIRNTMSVEVYPQPAVTLGAPANAIFNGESLTYTATVTNSPLTTYAWTVDGQRVGSDSPTYVYTGSCPADASQTHVIAVTATCTVSGKSISVEAEASVTVYPRPAVNISGDGASFSGQSVRFDSSVSGGVQQGRTYQWTHDGSTVGTAASLTVSPSNTTATGRPFAYRLTVTDRLEGGHTATATADVTLMVWPTPSTEFVNVNNTPANVYTGTSVNLNVTSRGGSPESWSYQWTNNSQNAGTGAGYSFTASASGSGATSYAVTVRAENRPAGMSEANAYVATYTFNVDAWAYPSVTGQSEYDNAGTAGNAGELSAYVSGGMPGTWSFVWRRNGSVIAGAGDATYRFTYPQVSAEQIDYYTVNVTNTINGVVVLEHTCDFGVYCYPALSAPSSAYPDAIRLSTQSVRRGNAVRATLTPAPSGGASWRYYWNVGGVSYGGGNSIDFIADMDGGRSMSTGQTEVTLALSNVSTNDITLFSDHYTSLPVTVYNSPELPDRLVRKGNGTTCTMIVEMPLDDSSLSELEYRYVFGYTEASGAERQLEQTAVRYQRFAHDVYNNSSNRFWVIAVWNYPDGSIVTSGKRYLDGAADTSYDGSLFGGRGGESAIGDVIVAEGEVVCDATGFKAVTGAPAEAVCEIYTLGGHKVAGKRYEPAAMFDEVYPTDGLAAGFYVVRIQVGASLGKTVKIAVK